MAETIKDAIQTVSDKVASTTIGSSSENAAPAQSQPNLQLDEETGEMVSKSERGLRSTSKGVERWLTCLDSQETSEDSTTGCQEGGEGCGCTAKGREGGEE